jgi:SAM-dependent methyltransferase
MRKHIKEFVRLCSITLPIIEPIYEFGSFQVKGQEILADLRPIFLGKKYVGCDIREGNGVDLVTDVMNISIADEKIGTVLCLDTYEHVENPIKATKEIFRVLKPNGLFILSSVMNFPIHDHPSDYWRFTPSCFKMLLNTFKSSFVGFGGKPLFPHTVVGIGSKAGINENYYTPITNFVNTWK